jgi:hypothetical protein
VHVEDLRFKVKVDRTAVAAAVDMASAAAGLAAHRVTNHIAAFQEVELNGSVSGCLFVFV